MNRIGGRVGQLISVFRPALAVRKEERLEVRRLAGDHPEEPAEKIAHRGPWRSQRNMHELG
jgi:hypothetical protein